MNVSKLTQKLISSFERWQKSQELEENTATIHVDEVASKVAAFYEKIRGIIDWKEEHLLKRRAIERILKRRLLIEEDNANIAESLILELIRGGHFPNNKIKESKIPQVQNIINKYVYILKNASSQEKKSKIHLYTWLSEIAACEIEEALSPSLKERALIDYMFEIIKGKIRISEKLLKTKKITEQKKDIQTYIAVQRALFNLDSAIISYHLLKYYYSNWTSIDKEKLLEITENIYSIRKKIDKNLNYSLGDKFYQIAEKYDTPYLLLGDVLTKNPTEVKKKISNPQELEKLIAQAYNIRVKTLKKRLGRAAFYSTLSIFLTNIISLLLIEIPFNKWVTGYFFNFWAMGIDIFIPTLLMFALVVTIKPPQKENFSKVIMEVMKIVYGKGEKDIYKIETFRKKNIIFLTVIKLFYLIGFLAVLGLIIWGLYKVNFPPLSYIIFIIFLSLIAFAGAKIRQRAKELQVIEEKDSFLRFIFDPFAVPVVQLGKWFTLKWKKYNIIAVFFSALIDMPFTIFVEFIEQWRYFLKEKKEKIH